MALLRLLESRVAAVPVVSELAQGWPLLVARHTPLQSVLVAQFKTWGRIRPFRLLRPQAVAWDRADLLTPDTLVGRVVAALLLIMTELLIQMEALAILRLLAHHRAMAAVLRFIRAHTLAPAAAAVALAAADLAHQLAMAALVLRLRLLGLLSPMRVVEQAVEITTLLRVRLEALVAVETVRGRILVRLLMLEPLTRAAVVAVGHTPITSTMMAQQAVLV